MDIGVIEGGLNVTLTYAWEGKDAEESGARISISEGNCPERTITLAGPTNAMLKAFAMIIDNWKRTLACGKGGCKRESTGAQVQVAGDMLPNSTERAITIAGIPQSITECVKQICVVMLESPKGVTIPNPPKPSRSPVVFAGGQDRYSPGSDRASFPHTTPSMCLNPDLEGPPLELTKLHQLARQQSHFPMTHGNTGFSGIASSSPEVKGYWAGLDASAQTTSHELTIPNDLTGCIIGRQGAKINEIRQMSGAQIKIANPVEGSTDRQVTITGSAASISLAQYLINVRLSSETGGLGSS
uniref:Poly(rC)-binding protein 2 pseudogene n=1 Tax=Jaculus jaculus TaxID=51337 RepID=A0A8C5P2N5_JACJA